MRKVRVGPSKILGTCPAGHRLGNEQVIDHTDLKSINGPICYVAVGALTNQVSFIQRETRISSHVSCPGCCTNPKNINKVVFMLGWEDVWNVVRKLSQYNWLRIDGRETEESNILCKKSWKLAWKGKAEEAEKYIDEALAEIR